jgi:hypothetical protein
MPDSFCLCLLHSWADRFTCHHTQLTGWDGVLLTFALDDFQLWSSDLCLLSSLAHRHLSLRPAYWLRWGLTNFLPGLISNCDPLCLHLPRSWDYRHSSTRLADFCLFYIKIQSINKSPCLSLLNSNQHTITPYLSHTTQSHFSHFVFW